MCLTDLSVSKPKHCDTKSIYQIAAAVVAVVAVVVPLLIAVEWSDIVGAIPWELLHYPSTFMVQSIRNEDSSIYVIFSLSVLLLLFFSK